MIETSKEAQVATWFERHSQTEQPIDLSVVIPAYNERWRLPTTLVETFDYLDTLPWRYEIIVVDDGSRDDTSEMVKKFEKIKPTLRLIRLPRNSGKGHAVRLGALNAKGRMVLFADADGSTPIGEVTRLSAFLNNETGVVVGSRAMASTDTKVETKLYRKIIGRTFNFFVNTFLLPGVADTQCGFKLFSAPAARYIFEQQHSDGFSFDLEILFIARKSNIGIKEVAVNWHHSPGSKVNLALDSMRMFRDIFVFRFQHRHVKPDDYKKFLDRAN